MMTLMIFAPWCHSSDCLRATERLYGWNKSNYTSPSKAKDFIWLVVAWMSKRCEAQERFDTPLLDLKMERAPWEEMRVPSRNGVWPPTDDQQGNRNLRPTATRSWVSQQLKWILEVNISQSLQTSTQLTFNFTLLGPERRTQPSLLRLPVIQFTQQEKICMSIYG